MRLSAQVSVPSFDETSLIRLYEGKGSVADFLALAGWGIMAAGLAISGAAGVG